jgi:hypothetical protein
MKKIVLAMAFSTLMLSSFTVVAQTQSREDLFKEISTKRAELDAKRAELTKLETAWLLPSEADRSAHANFLRQPGTGLIRLLPRQNEIKLALNGGGSYYSFVRLTHEYGYGSDISLDNGWLITGFAGADYGILTALGNTPLENVSLKTPSVQFLAAHTPPTEEPKARIEFAKWNKGEMIDGTNYGRQLRIVANTTYVLRSINYQTSDVLVAFRVVKIDTDDSAVILWKLLKTYQAPTLARK